jgi:hypothetical protein
LRQIFRQQLARDVNVGPFLKHSRDHGKSLNGFGTDGLKIAGAVQYAFDGPRHQRFHLLGRQPRRFGLHRDLRLHKLRKHVQLRIVGDEQTVPDEHAGQRHDNATVAQGKINNSFQHRLSPWLRSNNRCR